MKELPTDITDQIVVLMSPTLVKKYVEEHGYHHDLILPTIYTTRWMCMAKGISMAQYKNLVHTGIYLGGNWLEDLCYYGDRFYLEYAIKNFNRVLQSMPTMECYINTSYKDKPYLMALVCAHRRVPFTIYEHIKDGIKKDWDSASVKDKTCLFQDLVECTTDPLFEWIFKNIFTKDDRICDFDISQSRYHTSTKRYSRLIKYGKFFDHDDANTNITLLLGNGVIDKAFSAIDNSHNWYREGMDVHIIPKPGLDMKKLIDDLLEHHIELPIIVNAHELVYRKVYRPHEQEDLRFKPSKTYTRYTRDTIKRIKRIGLCNYIFKDVLEAAQYTSYKAFKHIAKLYKKHNVNIDVGEQSIQDINIRQHYKSRIKDLIKKDSGVCMCKHYNNTIYGETLETKDIIKSIRESNGMTYIKDIKTGNIFYGKHIVKVSHE